MNIKHNIVTLFLLHFMTIIMSISLSSQTVEKLVKINTKTNTSLSPFKVDKLGDDVIAVFNFINKDTLYIDGKPQDNLFSLSDNMSLVIGKYDAAHQLLKTGMVTCDYTSGLSATGNYIHNDKIYLFIESRGFELRYNGQQLWESNKTNDWEAKFTMLVLDSDLNLLDLKWIDHRHSGFDGIAFGEGRTYLFGRMTNDEKDSNPDTLYVDDHELISEFGENGRTTRFMLTYDDATGKIINDFKIHASEWNLTDETVNIKVGPDGTVYYLTTITESYWYKKEWVPTNVWRNNSFLFRYDKDGNLIDWVNFFLQDKGNDLYLRNMEMTKEGDILVYGKVTGSIGINGVEVIRPHLPYTAMLMKFDGKDMTLKWYDYLAVNIDNQLGIRLGGMTMDKDENIYIMNSHGIAVPIAEDKEGNTIKAGNHIYKYNQAGKRLSDTYSYSEFGHTFGLHSIEEDKVIILRGLGGLPGTRDSMLQIIKDNANVLVLFQYNLNKTSGFNDVLEQKNILAYPNPIYKDGLLTISSENSVFDNTFVIMDAIGRIKGRGILDDTGQIRLSSFHLRSGTYFIQLLDGMTQPFKIVIVG